MRKPLNKDSKKPRTKAPKIQRLVTPHVLQSKWRCIALKKQHTKKDKEEAADDAKLLAKRMKEAKENPPETDCQETEDILSESFYLQAWSPAKKDFLRVADQ